MNEAAGLQELIKTKLSDYQFVIATNREPYIHTYGPEGIKCWQPASGVTVALDPVMRACGGIWVAHGSGDADREVVDKGNKISVPPENPAYTLKRVWLTKEEEDGYYYGFANRTLWPLCHIVHVRPTFEEKEWNIYQKVNQYFAEAILQEVGSRKAVVWLQDYHLALAAKIIKSRRPDIITALFWHIPWPNPEAFRICPWRREIIEGMLSNDLLGFHIRYHCDNFLATVDNTLEARINRENSSVHCAGHTTYVRPFPISIDFEEVARASRDPRVDEEVKRIKKLIHSPYQFLAVGVDRIDYTKGILERFSAIDRFLAKYPEYQRRFVYLGIGAPSRTHIREYKKLAEDIAEAVEEINWKYGAGSWNPIVFLEETLEYPRILAYYKLANLGLVSSLHDGMNLVAKEFVAANNNGVLILSRFAGSSRELIDAVLVNPYDIERFADAIKFALEMPDEEKIRRNERLTEAIRENNIYRWAGSLVTELTAIGQRHNGK